MILKLDKNQLKKEGARTPSLLSKQLGTHVFYIIKYMYNHFLTKKREKMDAITALGAINSVVNYANSNNDDERQQKYTLELMKEQNRYNKESAAQNQEYAKEMFHYTGATAKVKQLKEAGLNPGLIYGMGTNASGSTTGAAEIAVTGLGTAPNVTGNRANKIAQTGMLLQLSKLQSEIDLNKSEAEAKKAKAGLENLQTNTEGLRQTGINLDNELKNIELNISN